MDENALEEVDKENILSMVSPVVRQAIIKTFQEHPEYLNKTEDELFKMISPSYNSCLLRDCFWNEYYLAKDTGKNKILMTRVYSSVFPTRDSFYDWIQDPQNIAWLMCPPVEEFIQMRVDNYLRRKEFSRISRMSLFDEKGNLKHKDFKCAVEVYKMYADRLHGAVIQRIEKKVQNIPADNISGSPEEIQKRIKELEAIQVDPKDEN